MTGLAGASGEQRTGHLYGVGLGPGDPELVTVKAARLIAAADVVAFHAARHGRSVARAVAAPYLREGQVEELLVYPVTTETTDHPGGYQGAIDELVVEVVNLGSGAPGRLRTGGFGAEPQHAIRPVARNLARIDLVPQPAVDDIPRPQRGPERCIRRIDTRDPCDQEVGLGEVEVSAEDDR